MLAGDVGKQGKCSLPCFLFLMYASAETLTNPCKKARISDSGSTHYLLNSRTISLVVLGYSRSNNCVYLLLPWLYLEFVQPSLDGPTSPLNGGSDSWSSFTLYVWFISVVTLRSQLQYISPHQSQSTQLRARTEDLSKWPALLFSWLWLYSLIAREESFKTKIFCKNISCAFSCS